MLSWCLTSEYVEDPELCRKRIRESNDADLVSMLGDYQVQNSTIRPQRDSPNHLAELEQLVNDLARRDGGCKKVRHRCTVNHSR